MHYKFSKLSFLWILSNRPTATPSHLALARRPGGPVRPWVYYYFRVFLIRVLCVFCRSNDRESLLNSHLYPPSCVKVQTNLPSVCHCGNSSVPVCLTETSTLDTTRPTVTYVTGMTGVCINSGRIRYVLVITVVFTVGFSIWSNRAIVM